MLEHVAYPQQIEVGHSGTGDGAEWLLDAIVLRNDHTGDEYEFPCGQWLNSVSTVNPSVHSWSGQGHDRKTLELRTPAPVPIKMIGSVMQASPIEFYPWTSSIVPGVDATLDAVAAFLRENTSVNLDVVGHVNGYQSSPDLKRLCEERAAAVARMLHDRGIARDRLVPAIGGCRREKWKPERKNNACVVLHAQTFV